MEDSEILARLKHERERIELVEAKLEAMRTMDRWRWGVGILVGLLLASRPEMIPMLENLLK